jgi:hypothetical protein
MIPSTVKSPTCHKSPFEFNTWWKERPYFPKLHMHCGRNTHTHSYTNIPMHTHIHTHSHIYTHTKCIPTFTHTGMLIYTHIHTDTKLTILSDIFKITQLMSGRVGTESAWLQHPPWLSLGLHHSKRRQWACTWEQIPGKTLAMMSPTSLCFILAVLLSLSLFTFFFFQLMQGHYLGSSVSLTPEFNWQNNLLKTQFWKPLSDSKPYSVSSGYGYTTKPPIQGTWLALCNFLVYRSSLWKTCPTVLVLTLLSVISPSKRCSRIQARAENAPCPCSWCSSQTTPPLLTYLWLMLTPFLTGFWQNSRQLPISTTSRASVHVILGKWEKEHRGLLEHPKTPGNDFYTNTHTMIFISMGSTIPWTSKDLYFY